MIKFDLPTPLNQFTTLVKNDNTYFKGNYIRFTDDNESCIDEIKMI